MVALKLQIAGILLACSMFSAQFIMQMNMGLTAVFLLDLMFCFLFSTFFFCQWFEDMAWVAFSIFNVLWATLFIIHWKRTSASLTYRWGTMDKKDDLLKDPRPLYKVFCLFILVAFECQCLTSLLIRKPM